MKSNNCEICGSNVVGSFHMCDRCRSALRRIIMPDIVEQKIMTRKEESQYVKELLEYICEYYGITSADARDRNRKKEYVIPRQIYVYIAWHKTKKLSLQDIGNNILRTHATVLHDIDVATGQIQVDKRFRSQVQEIIDNFDKIWNNETTN